MELSVKQNQVAKSETKNNALVAQKYEGKLENRIIQKLNSQNPW